MNGDPVDAYQLTAACLIIGCVALAVAANFLAWLTELWRKRLERGWAEEED